jgi:hypothetical protein
MTSFSNVHICIAFRLLRRGNMKLHALLGHPVSENFVSWCQTLKNSSASFLCIQETYRSSPRSRNLKVIQKCVQNILFDLKCICVWCLDNWSRILSGKPFNTFSMARLKTLQFRLTLALLFTPTHAFFFLSFTIFFSWSVIEVVWVSSAVVFFFILVTLDLCFLLIHRDLWNSQKWQILISNLQSLS